MRLAAYIKETVMGERGCRVNHNSVMSCHLNVRTWKGGFEQSFIVHIINLTSICTCIVLTVS